MFSSANTTTTRTTTKKEWKFSNRIFNTNKWRNEKEIKKVSSPFSFFFFSFFSQDEINGYSNKTKILKVSSRRFF